MLLPWLADDATGTEITFWLCALGGTLFFVLRVLLVLVAGLGSEGFDVDHDGHIDTHAHDGVDSDTAFKLISFNSISGFAMMFGWAGLTSYVQFALGPWISVVLAGLVGFLTMVLTAYMFKWAYKLTSDGADFNLEQLVGKTGQVYQRIPADGQGKIQIGHNDMLREVFAQSESGKDIESFATVEVRRVISPTVVSVQRVEEL